VLDDLLAPIAARQIEIDVGPLAALFRQEPLEQQIHADRIDRGNPEAVADGAVGGAAASLHEDVVPAAEIDDVPDDEEVAGELELLDEIELARNLRAGAIVTRAVAFARADVGNLPQERRLRLAGRHRIIGKAIAEIRHRVLQAVGELARPLHRVAAIAKQLRHLAGRLQIPLGIRRQPAAGLGDGRVMVNAREDVEQRPLDMRREPHAVGRDRRNAECRREADERLRVALLVAAQMTLQLDVHVGAAEHADEAIEQSAHAVPADVERGAAGQGDEPARVPVEIVERQRAFALTTPPRRRARWGRRGVRAHLHARDQL